MEGDSDSGCIYAPKSKDWQRCILSESQITDMTLTKLYPFAVQKGILGIAGTVKDVKKQILVKCSMPWCKHAGRCSDRGFLPLITKKQQSSRTNLPMALPTAKIFAMGMWSFEW